MEFGRNVCRARNPLCEVCPISSYCNFYSFSKGFKVAKQ
ncbi:MAG TPA: hypothetical protein ENF87_00350 [Thermoproteales archaeon]|nr:hypothetical protein [Thermoproteales archaeon]